MAYGRDPHATSKSIFGTIDVGRFWDDFLRAFGIDQDELDATAEAADRLDAEIPADSGVYVSSSHAESHYSSFAPANSTERAMAALGSVESGGGRTGRINYAAVGPTTRGGHHALGAWQVMSFNVGPWAKEAGLGHVTPQQFIDNPDIQRQVVTHKIGQWVAAGKSMQDIASLWHSGVPYARSGNRADVNMSTHHYVDLVMGHYDKLDDSPVMTGSAHSNQTTHLAQLKASGANAILPENALATTLVAEKSDLDQSRAPQSSFAPTKANADRLFGAHPAA